MQISNNHGRDFYGVLFTVCTLITIISACIIVIFVLYFAYPVFQREGISYLISSTWDYKNNIYGILPYIIGTLTVTTVTVLMAAPLSILTAIFLAEFAPQNMSKTMRLMIELLVGIPSVVYGLLGLVVLRNIFATTIDPFISKMIGFIPIFKDVNPGNGLGILLASTVLTIMILPTITALSEEALRSVPEEYREASYAIGSTKWETIKHVIMPSALPGILTGVILGVMRAMGETMAIIMLIGNSPHIPTSILDTGYVMTSKIVFDIQYFLVYPEARSALFGLAAVLFLIEILFLIIARSIGRKAS